jgi:phage terminase small subunit
MPILSNPKHEKFARALVKGMSQLDAATEAGYGASKTYASNLTRRPQIVARVQELQMRGAERAAVTIESLILEAGEIQRRAMEDGQYSAATAALTAKAKLAGKWVEKSEVGKPGDFDRMTEEELETFITQRLGAGGRGHEGAGAAAGQTGMRGKPNGLH